MAARRVTMPSRSLLIMLVDHQRLQTVQVVWHVNHDGR